MTVWDVAATMLLLVFVRGMFLLSSNISFVLCRLFFFFFCLLRGGDNTSGKGRVRRDLSEAMLGK